VRAEERGEDPNGGGLARPVGAEHAQDRAGRHLQVDALQRLHLAEPLREALDDDRRIGHGARHPTHDVNPAIRTPIALVRIRTRASRRSSPVACRRTLHITWRPLSGHELIEAPKPFWAGACAGRDRRAREREAQPPPIADMIRCCPASSRTIAVGSIRRVPYPTPPQARVSAANASRTRAPRRPPRGRTRPASARVRERSRGAGAPTGPRRTSAEPRPRAARAGTGGGGGQPRPRAAAPR